MDSRSVITLSPFYHSAVNAVTEPNRLVFCSRYLVERWSRLLGGTGLQILLYLRAHCYHDRRTGECRNHWQVSRAEIAGAVGVSEATVKRELAHNAALRRFVEPQQEYRLGGGRGGVRRDSNSYRIAMDDPVHEEDWPRVAAYVREAEARAEKGAGQPGGEDAVTAAKRRAKQVAPAAVRPEREAELAPGQIDPALAQSEAGVKLTRRRPPMGVNLTPASGQIDPTESGGYSEENPNELTLNVGKPNLFTPFEEPPNETGSTGPGQSASRKPRPRNLKAEVLDRQAAALAAELHDLGSERRHRQLLSVCEQHGLRDLPGQALHLTRQRLAKEGKKGVVERPGAYYARILVTLLEAHQVFVPTLAEKAEDDPQEVRRLIKASLDQSQPDVQPGPLSWRAPGDS
ncbi:MAG: hypothetical protein JO250_20685 [Armatimonadetes bacterium]|nr:hypothetical protein [Armatimonadota bacterium]